MYRSLNFVTPMFSSSEILKSSNFNLDNRTFILVLKTALFPSFKPEGVERNMEIGDRLD